MTNRDRPVGFDSDPADGWTSDEAEKPVRVWSAEEVQSLQSSRLTLSPWGLVGWQAGMGLVVVALVAAIARDRAVVASALMGAVAIVVPSALMAWGVTRSIAFMTPGGMAVRFMLWEFIKILVSVSALWLAPKLVQPLNWPILLVSVVLCLKVGWVALLWRRHRLDARH
jgi:ATP synthase protein I